MKRTWLIASLLLIIAVLMILPVDATFTSVNVGAPRIPLRAGTSLNWAGYADVVQAGSVTLANGSFIVPNVQASRPLTYVAVWVGIDGYNDSTVEQTGILAESSHNTASYSAWYEFYPASPVYAPSKDVVNPEDHIVAWVQYNSNNNTFTTVIKDLTEGWTFISPATAVSGADRSSAEFIVERPEVGGTLSTLANFGKASFGYSFTSITGTCTATVNGYTSNIGSFNYESITMVNNNGQTLAYHTALTGGGTSFQVIYNSISRHK